MQKKKCVTDGRTDGPTNRLTVTYRVACTWLKRNLLVICLTIMGMSSFFPPFLVFLFLFLFLLLFLLLFSWGGEKREPRGPPGRKARGTCTMGNASLFTISYVSICEQLAPLKMLLFSGYTQLVSSPRNLEYPVFENEKKINSDWAWWSTSVYSFLFLFFFASNDLLS